MHVCSFASQGQSSPDCLHGLGRRAGGPVNPNWQVLQSSLQNGHRKRPKLEDGKKPKKLLKGPEQLGTQAGVTQVLAVDCEMVGVGPEGSRSALARCVNHLT